MFCNTKEKSVILFRVLREKHNTSEILIFHFCFDSSFIYECKLVTEVIERREAVR